MRRRILFALTLVVGVIVFPGNASATDDLLDFQLAVDEMLAVDPTLDPPPNDGKHDFVVGGFQDAFGFNNGISAHSGPAGEDPTGHVSSTHPNLKNKIREDVVCVAVLGKLAAVGVRGQQWFSAGSRSPQQEVLLLRDGGPGGAADGFQTLAQNPENCQAYLAQATLAPPIVSGNILVNDAQP
jgi:hypothetical protein